MHWIITLVGVQIHADQTFCVAADDNEELFLCGVLTRAFLCVCVCSPAMQEQSPTAVYFNIVLFKTSSLIQPWLFTITITYCPAEVSLSLHQPPLSLSPSECVCASWFSTKETGAMPENTRRCTQVFSFFFFFSPLLLLGTAG